MEQWIILALAISGIVFTVGYMVYQLVRQGYPEGEKHSSKWKKYKVNLIIHEDATIGNYTDDLKQACLNAIKAVVSAHNSMRDSRILVRGMVDPVKGYFKEYNVYLIPDNKMPPGVAAFTTKVDNIPTCTVSDSYVKAVINTGEPVIHEAMHAVLNDYVGSADDHEDTTIWSAAGGEDALQSYAREVYTNISGSLHIS